MHWLAVLRLLCLLIGLAVGDVGPSWADKGGGGHDSGASSNSGGNGNGNSGGNGNGNSGGNGNENGNGNSGGNGNGNSGGNGNGNGNSGGNSGDQSEGSPGSDIDDQHRARQAVQEGRALPLATFVSKIERQYRGHLIDAALSERRGRLVYELKMLSDVGRIFVVDVDAATGRPQGLFGF